MEVGDDAVHGELAYAIFYDGQHSHIRGDLGRMPDDSHRGFVGGNKVMMGQPVTQAKTGSDEESGGLNGKEGVKSD